MSAKPTRRVIDVADEDGAAFLRAVCREAGVDVEEAGVRTADVVLMLAIIGVPAAISFVVERWHDRLRGGQIIDLRPGAERLAHRDPGLTFGLVIVRAVDGSATIRVHEPASPTLELVRAVVSALGGMTGAGIHAARTAAAEIVGDRGTVTSGEPDPADPAQGGP